MKIAIRIVLTSILMSLSLILAKASLADSSPSLILKQQVTITPVAEATEIPTSANGEEIVSSVGFTQKDLSLLTGNIQRPNALVWNDGKIFAACSGDWTVYQIDADTGETAQYIYGVKNAHSMIAKTDGTKTSLWIPDFQSNNFVEISQGVVRNIATDLNGPWGVAQVDDSRFLITNLRGNNVVSIGADSTKEIITKLRSPTGIVVDDKYIYVANTGSARRAIEWFDLPAGNDVSINAEDKSVSHALVSGLQNVTNIVMGADGLLYFGYSLGTRGVVGRVDPSICRQNGGCTNDQTQIVIYSELAAPLAGITLSPDMRIYIHSIFSPEIYWVDLKKTPLDQ